MHQISDTRVTRILWTAAILVLAFVASWPAIGGMLAVNDDIKFVRVPAHAESVAKQVADAWRTSPSFRPMELWVAAGCDERTLACPIAIIVQACGLALLSWGVVALARIVMPGEAALAPIALIWIAMSPGTTCAAWQIDAGSQTWSAALGTWACVLCWRSFDAARAGRIAWGALVMLTLVFALGVNIKETFYGWSAGIGLVAIAANAWLLVRDRAAAVRAMPTLLPVVALPVAHMAARWFTGAMARSAEGGSDSRYQIELGMNLVINAAQSVAGAVGTGPFYLLTDEQAPIALRALLPVAGLVELCLLAAAIEFVVLRSTTEARARWVPVTLACLAGMISLSVTFPMGSVSELYGFGANVMIGLLAGTVLTCLWRTPRHHGMAHAVANVGGVIVLLVGLYGLVGRAHLFGNVWRSTRTANEQILAFMDTRPAAPKYGDAPLSTIYFPASCRPERSYGAYIMPVAQAIDIINTTQWMQRLHPRHPTTFSVDTDAPNHGPYDVVVGCDAMPRDGHW